MSFSLPGLGQVKAGNVIVCAFIALSTLAPAQAAHEHEENAPDANNPDLSVPRLSVPEYRSPLSAYKSYDEDDFPGWKEANDRVGELGGWRFYTREAFESEDKSDDMEKDTQ